MDKSSHAVKGGICRTHTVLCPLMHVLLAGTLPASRHRCGPAMLMANTTASASMRSSWPVAVSRTLSAAMLPMPSVSKPLTSRPPC